MTFQASVLLLLGRKLKTYVYESRYAKTLAIATRPLSQFTPLERSQKAGTNNYLNYHDI